MRRLTLVFGIAFLVLAGIVFALASGARRIYSGSFFAVIGIVSIANAIRWGRADKD